VLQVLRATYRRYLAARDQYDLIADELETLFQQLFILLAAQRAVGQAYTDALPPATAPVPAEPIARSLKIYFRGDGSASIQIDGKPPFRLSRGLAALLKRLATDEGPSNDKLVGWKSRPSLLLWFQKTCGKPVGERLVNKRVHDLRNALEKAGFERGLVQTNLDMGRRFALPRKSSRVPPTLAQGVRR
jgi:hypothetical protein